MRETEIRQKKKAVAYPIEVTKVVAQSEKVKAGESCVVKNIWLYVDSFLIDPRLKNSSGDVRS